MPAKRNQASVRKPRSDAQRNRERILEVAKGAFTRSGANTSLDDIARDAEVGPGTLYRHFPTREKLLEAVYRTEMEKLASAEQKFAEELPPIEALRASTRCWVIQRKCSRLPMRGCGKRCERW
jgi:AcrR family transcriptional regulator